MLTMFYMQSNNCYIFPGMGLGCVISGAIRVHDDMFLAAGKKVHVSFQHREFATISDFFLAKSMRFDTIPLNSC